MLNTRNRLPGASLRAAALAAIAVAVAALVLNAPNVFAHAGYDHSTPGDGEVVATAPARVDVYFSQQVAREGGLPTLVVVNEAGDIVDKGSVLDDDDRTHISAELEDDLRDGRYTVIWHTLSLDDDEDAEGAFHFYVGAGPTPVGTGNGNPTSTPVATNPATEDDGGGEIPIWGLIAGIIGGVVVGGAAGTVLGRRSGS
jgi:methionine-rich copper-binding protein CopC